MGILGKASIGFCSVQMTKNRLYVPASFSFEGQGSLNLKGISHEKKYLKLSLENRLFLLNFTGKVPYLA